MRIISGKYGGRTLKIPKGLPVRPTTDRTKESLFNILHQRVDWEGLRVLDLFSGTGNISFECWSRGAAEVVSVDRHPRCVRAIKQGLQALGQTGKVIQSDVRSFLKKGGGPFDLIFLDPPYDMEGQEELLELLWKNNWLAEDGWLIIEHRSQKSFDSLPHFAFRRDYGSSSLSFFQRGEDG
ncbi:MAG: 16S rRNA (guanine(966)-N(2))-methyltransferase RsmD [Bacteroidota bacterium]